MSRPILGVVLCDLDTYAVDDLECHDDDAPTISDNPVGFFENPRSWPGIPVTYAVARGARVEPLVAGEQVAIDAFRAAAERLSTCSLVITDCGFFYYARGDGPVPDNVLTSGLDLLPLAATITSGDIGVLTVSSEPAERMLAEHDLRDRLVVAGLEGEDGWNRLLTNDHAHHNGWTLEDLRSGVRAAAERELGPGGRLAHVGVLVLECTLLPQFREEIRRFTDVPILDAASFAIGALGPGFDLSATRADDHPSGA